MPSSTLSTKTRRRRRTGDQPFTIPELSRRWRCRRDLIYAYIRAGQLAVLPAPGGNGARRRHYRISLAAVVAFEAGVREAPVVRRRGKQLGDYKRFFSE